MTDRSDFTKNDVVIDDELLRHDGFLKLKEYHLKHKLLNGGWSDPLVRECLIRPPSIAVLPYDPSEDAIVLVQQFRIGALDYSTGPWTIELIAGLVDPNETTEYAAKRECLEEAGVELLALEKICEYLVSPGGSNEQVFLFCGKMTAKGVGGCYGLEDEGEDIWANLFSRQKAIQMVGQGYIKNASTIIALQWLDLNYQRLQKNWCS